MTLISAVGYEEEGLREEAQLLAQNLNFLLDKDANPCLFLSHTRLALKMPSFSLLHADFSSATWSKRKSEGKKQGLIRACKPVSGMKIIDATAGWGRDSALLACFGAQVLMLERHPVMAALLADALLRESKPLQLTLCATDAFTYLSALAEQDYPDVIYIDPMHPQRSKSALVKKDMQVLQQLIGADSDALALIQLARTRVKQRVVVKWPQKTQPLLPSNACVEGKTVRFDIYFP